jgi:type IV pilus assembly protein PilP
MRTCQRVMYTMIWAASIVLLSSCDGDRKFKDLHVYIENLKQSKTLANNTSRQTKKISFPVSAKYEAATKRSPFAGVESMPAGKGVVSSNPLQAYPLDMLRFVGTVTHGDATVAFVTAPDNKIYQVKVGDVLGDHQSQIVSIDSDSISLTENVTENGNAPMKRVVTLQLKEASQ